MRHAKIKTILWWGRLGNYGPDYPRNRTVIDCLESIGFSVVHFQPRISAFADLEAKLKSFHNISAVWVPCFRQRDVSAAARWSRRNGVPLIFDPLISAFDKRVGEKRKYAAHSLRGKRLLAWERKLFADADHLIADTQCHKEYFSEQLQFPIDNISVVPVSAEENLFYPRNTPTNEIPEALFFGTFIGLQGAEFIARSIQFYAGPAFRMTFLGQGPDRVKCEEICAAYPNDLVQVKFEDWIAFEALPERIADADLCLGVFGTGEKTARVIPNKVYQALACGKPVLTMFADAYPPDIESEQTGISWVKPGSPEAIATSISELFSAQNLRQKHVEKLPFETYRRYFSNHRIRTTLSEILKM